MPSPTASASSATLSSSPTSATFNRRRLLQTLGAGFWAVPAAWAQTASAPESIAGQASPARLGGSFDVNGRLVVVFLRGAYDGLSALVPYSDPNYYRLRPNIAIAAPDGTAQTTLALDAQFGLHPALAALAPLWQQGVLGVVPAAGSPDPTRSHFDAQLHWELGMPGQNTGTGWLNRLVGPVGQALGVGEANPLILSGPAAVQLVPKGLAATRQGVLGDERTRRAVLNMYGGDDALSKAFRAGADSRMQTAQTLTRQNAMANAPAGGADMTGMGANMGAGMSGMSAEMVAANNGAAGSPKGLQLDAQHLGTLMRQNPMLRLGFLSAGGWDTHANQGTATGNLAQNLGNLSAALLQLRRDFANPNDVVLVCSEFGRTSAENGTQGTDHGHGNALWLMGNAVQGGRWHGQWQGLAPQHLHEGRDLPVHHDFRAIIAQVLQRTQGLDRAALNQLFPGFGWDTALNGLMRA